MPALGGMDDRHTPGGEHLAHLPATGHRRARRRAGAEILDELHRAERGAERTREGRHRRRVHARGEQPKPTLDHPGQIELLPERVVAVRWRPVLAREIPLQPVRGQTRMCMQVGYGG